MESKDFVAARKIALKAQQLYPDLENITQMLIVCDVHCSAERKLFGNETDWYGILQIGQSADETMIKKQYRKFALQLHPDKNKFSGAEAAFKLIGEAQRVLLDKNKRYLLDMKYKVPMNRTPKPHQPAPKFHTNVNAGVQNNVRANFSNINTQKQQQQQPRQSTQQGPNSNRPNFSFACPFCTSRYEIYFEGVTISITCHTCHKPFVAHTSAATNSSFQSVFGQQKDGFNYGSNVGSQGMNVGNDDTKSTAQKGPSVSNKQNKKRKRKKAEESSESADSLDSNDSEEDIFVDKDGVPAEQNYPTGREQHPRRSARSKPQVIYNENGSDDDDEDGNVKPSTRVKGSGSCGGVGDVNGETAKMNFPNDSAGDLKNDWKKVKQEDNRCSGESLFMRNEKTLDSREKEAKQCSKGTGEDEEAQTEYRMPDSEFSDFEKDKKEGSFAQGQVWAIYDPLDGMPRFYALIKKVLSPGFKLRITWLEANPDDKDERNWVENDLPVACGKYKLGQTETSKDCNVFSHLLFSEKMKRDVFKVFPRKGQTWALFKNWDIKWYMDLESHQDNYEYEYVEILSDYVEGEGVSVAHLEKLEGFVSLFDRAKKGDVDSFQIPAAELFRFSHIIPSFKMTGQERVGVPKGSFEFDPACLPAYIWKIADPEGIEGQH